MKPRTAQLGVRENPVPLLRQHGSHLAANSIQPISQEATSISSNAEYSSAAFKLKKHTESNGIESPITCEEASRILRVHPRTIKRMARRGEVPGHFRFGRWFFYPSELDAWMRTELHSSRHSCR
jgi:excisionase family DNA binding protein